MVPDVIALLTTVKGEPDPLLAPTARDAWVEREMNHRYSCPAVGSGPFKRSVVRQLGQEWKWLRSLQDQQQVSRVAQGRTLSYRDSGPLGDGVDWDYQDGMVVSEIRNWKSIILSMEQVARTVEDAAPEFRSGQMAQMLGLSRHVYVSRARLHRWGIGYLKPDPAGAERRWIAAQLLSFAVSQMGMPFAQAWIDTGALEAYGGWDQGKPDL